MKMKPVLGFVASLCCMAGILPAHAFEMTYGSVRTPYGSFACKSRTENALFGLGATNIRGNKTIWANHRSSLISVWCRGEEAIIVIGGPSETSDLYEEVRRTF
jgi:hypothetical protein